MAWLVALLAGLLALEAAPAAWAQEEASCEASDLGALGAEPGSELQASGSWTTEDCDSRFRSGSDAHTYSFEVVEGGRTRIDLKSEGADSFLYLLDQDAGRITDNDDGGAGLDARVERDLAPGTYLIEATTVGGRGRGAADFALSISRATGCDPVHLGTLEPGIDLTASGSWSLDTCGSRFVVEHPAYGYSFNLLQDARVRIDLTSENGDPVLSLVSATRGLISANDDGGERRNSRIEQYLQADTYLIEATTYLERDLQPLEADFDLVVHLVDEEAQQNSFRIKIEAADTPAQVIAGEPFTIHYRAGNLGSGDLVDVGGSVEVYVVGPRVYDYTDPITGSADRWQAGVSYHSGEKTASDTSVAIDEVTPFTVTLNRPGPSWVFIAVITSNEAGNEVGFHGIWKNLMVLSSLTFDTVRVKVDEADYRVSAEADDDGVVTTSVKAVANPAEDLDEGLQGKAVYTAGVLTRVLDGIFQRPAVAGLSVDEDVEPEAVTIASPSSSALRKLFAEQYASAIAASGLSEGVAAGEAINPMDVEDLVLGAADTASAQYASLAASWTALQERIEGGERLSLAEALVLQSQIAYAERVVAPAVTAGQIVQASRDTDLGWEDPEVQAMAGDLAGQASCGDGATALGDALRAAGVADVAGMLALDAELRPVLPVYGLANDSALCGAAAVDGENSRFLQLLAIDDNEEITGLLASDPPPPPAPSPHPLRIIARVGEDGRVEHGVEISGSGEQVLPTVRYLPAGSPVGEWRASSDVEVEGDAIGKIRSRRLADGRVELGFQSASGDVVMADIRYVPADAPTGVWLRSGEVEVPPPVAMLE